MKIVICWERFSGYMSACWRALAAQEGVELFVISTAPTAGFDDRHFHGFDYHILTPQEAQDSAAVLAKVVAQQPQVVVLCGWRFRPYVRLAYAPELASTKFVLTMDTPLKMTWRQWAARMALCRYLARMDRVVVAGERSWQYAKYLRVPERKLRRGMYGIDEQSFLGLHARRMSQSGGWPRRFLYMGRYVTVKAIDVMLAAYARYRSQVSDPWPLTCCGQGPFAQDLAGAAGVVDRGFVQPIDQPQLLIEQGVFLLLSRFDPWPLVLVEAMAAGLPVICTEACGSAVELVREQFNGLTVATEDVEGAATAMRWMHDNHAMLSEMGLRSAALAVPYGSQLWAQRWGHMCRELVAEAGVLRGQKAT